MVKSRERKVKDTVKVLEGLKSRPTEVARLLDKNSRTMSKILQLLEVAQRPGAAQVDKDGVVMRHVEKLKFRLNRRLTKLSKWSDLGFDDRLPRLKKTDPRITMNGGSYLPPPASQYCGTVTYGQQPGICISANPSDASSAGSGGTTSERRDLMAPQRFTVNASATSSASIGEMYAVAMSINSSSIGLTFQSERLKGFGEVSWKDYSHPANANGYCAIYHNERFYVGPITESHGAVVRIGSGEKGRISLNKIQFKSPPFEKPEGRVSTDGDVTTQREAGMARVKELYDHITTKGWKSRNGVYMPPMAIPFEKIAQFEFVYGHPENCRPPANPSLTR